MEKIIYVQGMTCAACEKHVGDALLSIKGVESAKVNRRQGKAVLAIRRPLSESSISRALEEGGYSLGSAPEPWIAKSRQVWRDFGLGVALVLALLVVSNLLGVFDLLQGFSSGGASSSLFLTMLMVLALGVTASVSTCMALAGGLVLGISASFAKSRPQATRRELLLPHIAFNVGRVLGFGLLGALIGALGQLFVFQGAGLAAMTLLVAAVMFFLGIRLTEISPRLAAFSFSLPAGVAKLFEKEDRILEDEARSSYAFWKPVALGAASFFLPCGFTGAVQIFALGTGSPLLAGLTLAVFAIGTAPGLLGIASLPAFATGAASKKLFRILGVAVLSFSLMNANALAGAYIPGYPSAVSAVSNIFWGLGASEPGNAELSSNVQFSGTDQTVTTTVANGYSPAVATIYAGVPTHWQLKYGSLSCASSINAQALGISKSIFVDHDLTVDFKIDKPGRYDYSCAMGMYYGTFIVIEKP